MNLKMSLKQKFIILVIIFATLLSGVALWISSRTISNMVDESYQNRANEIAATVARVIDAEAAQSLSDRIMAQYHATENKVSSEEWGSDEFNAYIAEFEHYRDSDEYKKLLQQMRSLQEVNSVDCIYMWDMDFEGKQCVYIVDAALEDECPPGCFDPLYDFNEGIIENPDQGLPAYITDTEEYGWLVTAAAPIYNAKSELVSYACVDISMEMIREEQRGFIRTLAGVLIALTVLICYVAIKIIDRNLVNPVNLLSDAALRYRESKRAEKAMFDELDIHTGDEIEILHNSMVQMEKDIDNYIDDLVKTRQQLSSSKQKAAEMDELAHKDSLTGIRNKLAYDQAESKLRKELKDGETKFGIAVVDLNDLKYINDNYGHDCGNVALVRVAKHICDVFLHSPVFRIGGDEFAVILKNNDYDKIESLCAEFDERLAAQDKEDLQPWEKVKAAIGYALYDPKVDESVDDVFRRADQEMYQKKVALKKKARKESKKKEKK